MLIMHKITPFFGTFIKKKLFLQKFFNHAKAHDA